MINKKEQLQALTGMRFYAALLVFAHHINYLSNGKWISAFPDGYMGVTFFYILSGFILSYCHQHAFKSNEQTFGGFYLNRIARIVPLHWLTLLFVVIFIIHHRGVGSELKWSSLAANIMLLQAFVPDDSVIFSYNWVAWSLSCEMFFYLLFPWLVKRHTQSLVVFGFAIAAGQLLVAQGKIFQQDSLTYTPMEKFFCYFFPPSRLFDFILGICLYRLWILKIEIKQHIASGLQLAALVLLAACVWLSSKINPLLRFDLYYAIPLALLVFVFTYHDGLFARVVSTRVSVYLGEVSFAIYMVHQLVIRGTFGALSHGHAQLFQSWLNVFVFAGVCMLASLVVSMLLYEFYEIPMKNRVRTLFMPLLRAKD